MNDGDWYELVEGPVLRQGDILRNCPVFSISGNRTRQVVPAMEVDIDWSELDLVVMTQSCDLENDKVDDVLLARMIAWSDAVRGEAQRGNNILQSSKFRRQLIDGNLPGLSLLHKRELEPSLPWSVVDFHRLFTLPKDFARQVRCIFRPGTSAEFALS